VQEVLGDGRHRRRLCPRYQAGASSFSSKFVVVALAKCKRASAHSRSRHWQGGWRRTALA
jgi:hypothetical protein